MKTSIYNFVFDNGENYILYNAFSDEVIFMKEELYKIYTENFHCVDNLKQIHPDFYHYLLIKKAIVDEGVTESDLVVKKWEEHDYNSRTFTVTINPTMDCNMSCWYCYEQHGVNSKMSNDISNRVLSFVEELCTGNEYDTIILSFFGGEPLLYFEELVYPLINKVSRVCIQNNKELRTHFTTNGFLISEKILKNIGEIPTSFQITLDGNATIHNKTKIVKDKRETYLQTINNIKMCLSNKHIVSVRLNFTESTLPYFVDVLSDFSDIDNEAKSLLCFNFQRIWQDKSRTLEEDLQVQIRKLESLFCQQGFSISPYTSNMFGRCYADKRDSIVVNYDGNVFKCTARKFTKENRDGVIRDNGNIEWEERHAHRINLIYGNKTCRECRIYPLCHGGCSQCKIENNDVENKCLKGFSDNDKLQLVQSRIKDILLVYNSQLERKKI